jgi:hypothetical protein
METKQKQNQKNYIKKTNTKTFQKTEDKPMPTYKTSKRGLEERREIIRGLLARGVTTPGRIYKQKELHDIYSIYKNPYDIIINDIKQVTEENKKLGAIQETELSRGEYIIRIQEQLQACWSDYPKLNDNGKTSMMKVIMELNRDLARIKGINPDTVDPSIVKIIDSSTNIKEGPKLEITKEDLKEIGNLMAKQRTDRIYSGESKGNSKIE